MAEKVVKRKQYVRVKRKETTYFLICDEYDTLESIKNRIAVLAERTPDTIRLYLDKKVGLSIEQIDIAIG